VEALGTRVPFSDSLRSFRVRIEQFWGRAARASWIRKNPDACLILCVSNFALARSTQLHQAAQFCSFKPRTRRNSFSLFVTSVNFDAMACAAIQRSLFPMISPFVSSSARMVP